jgi:3-oxoacyl-[acyl-carrier protein] reductase
MDLKLQGKNVLVTGSSRGIGFAIATALIEEGCQLILNSTSELGEKARQDLPASKFNFVKADVTSIEGRKAVKEAVLDHFKGSLDVLICNVGSGKSAAPGRETIQDWTSSFQKNFFSTTNLVQELIDFITPNTGSILCISSICGIEYVGAPLTYTASKAALNSYVVGVSKLYGKEGIRVNALAPGNIFFEDSTWDRKMKENPMEVEKLLHKEVALKRLGTTEEIASVAAFLVSEKASFITGAIIVADGGQIKSW